MDKKVLRKKYIELRKTILEKDYKSDLILEKVLKNSVFKQAKVVAIYVNLKDEVFTEKIINEAFIQNKIVVVPKVINKEDMSFYKIKSLNELVSISNFNIKEPIGDINNLVLPSDIDLFIVPGVCFDKDKNRIGYGNGYYDRYLLNSNNSYKIGLAYSEQILNNLYIDYESTDVKLDEVVTDKILIK